MKYKYKLSSNTWNQKEIDAINRVVISQNFAMGKEVLNLEKKFANYFGAKYCVMSNSGSSANLLGIASLIYSGKLKKGDEVIVPAVSWSTTYFPLLQYGLKVKFVDIDIDSLNFNLNEIGSFCVP
jgi:CDP-6-deoxy-D-xylo-4-hexulose-3-dehydrase